MKVEHTLNVVHRGAVVEVHGERTNHTYNLNPIKLNAFTEMAECGCVMRVGLKFLVCLVCVVCLCGPCNLCVLFGMCVACARRVAGVVKVFDDCAQHAYVAFVFATIMTLYCNAVMYSKLPL